MEGLGLADPSVAGLRWQGREGRVALWGGIGGSLLILVAVSIAALVGASIGSGVLGGLMGFFLLGAGCASGSVALAKRADTKLLGGGEEQVLPLEEG